MTKTRRVTGSQHPSRCGDPEGQEAFRWTQCRERGSLAPNDYQLAPFRCEPIICRDWLISDRNNELLITEGDSGVVRVGDYSRHLSTSPPFRSKTFPAADVHHNNLFLGTPQFTHNLSKHCSYRFNMVSDILRTYSIPSEAQKLFRDGILDNPLVSKDLPPEIKQCAEQVSFEGTDLPSIPINWRFAESVSALKALEASMVNVLLLRKYGVEPAKVKINTYGSLQQSNPF
jgi:hypothetical protein